MKKKDLKQKGFGNKPNAAQPVETEDIEKMWSSGAISLQNPRSLLHLVWCNNVTHLGTRGFKVVLYSKKVMLGCKSHFFLNGKIVNLKHLGMLS